MKKTAEISLELAKQMYKEGGVAKGFALENFTKEELTREYLPKSWKDLEEIRGYHVNIFSTILYHNDKPTYFNRYTFRTKEQAEAVIAMAQLSQLMYVYNDGWIPDWSDTSELKYRISFYSGKVLADSGHYLQTFLAFKTKEIRDEFLENFKDLILKAEPLL